MFFQKEIETMKRSELEALQLERLKWTVDYCYKNVPFYTKKLDEAGVTADKLLLQMTEADFDAVIETNLKGAFFCTKAAARLMMRQRYGRIISVSSVVGLHGNAGQANYAASKAGLIGLMKSVAKEYASRGVTANTVAPGFITTDMTAVNFLNFITSLLLIQNKSFTG